MTAIITLFGTAASLWAAVWMVSGFEYDGDWWHFLIISAIVGLANAIIKPIVKAISLPVIAVTLGLFLIVVNALILQLVVWLTGPELLDLGLTSEGFFWSTFWASIVVSVVGWILGLVLPDEGRLSRTT